MRIALIVATDLDGTIGRDNRMPWHLPADLAHFRRVTLGKAVIMGRRTHESIGKPLAGRVNIVLSRRPGYAAPGCEVAAAPEAALELAARLSPAPGAEVMVIGGAAVFRIFLPQAARLYWTLVQAHVPGDARFPNLDAHHWHEIERTDHPADARHAHAFSIRVLDRRGVDRTPEVA